VSSGLEGQNVSCYFDLKKQAKFMSSVQTSKKIQEVSYEVAEFL